jgi:hypothetical protein
MPRATLGSGTTFPYVLGSIAPPIASGIGTRWDVGIDGIGYLLSTLDQESPFEYRAYTMASVPRQKGRLDTSDEPGEHTFDDWWSRAQHSWHEGAGQEVLDAANSSRFAFHSSFGIDIWTDGRIKLLKATSAFETGTDNNLFIVVDGDKVHISEGATISQLSDLDSPSLSTKSPALGNVIGMDSDGEYVYASFPSNGLYRCEIAGWAGDSFTKVNDLIPDVFAFVKGRIIAGIDNGLHEITDLTSTTDGATAFFNHLTDSWVWNAITDSGQAIYCAGYAGDKSAIYAIGYDTTDVSAGLTIGAPRLAWEAPEGEIIHSIKGFLSKGVLIGTSRGVRIGLVTTLDGDFEVSPLVVELDNPVRCFTTQGDYAWFGWENFDGTYSGLGRIHLGDYSYASDLMYAAQGRVTSVGDYNGRVIFSTTNTGGTTSFVAQEASDLVAVGWLRTGEIRFGTFEEKRLNYFDARLVGDGGTMGMDISTDDEAFIAILSDQAVGQTIEPITYSGSRFDFKFYLKRSTGDSSVGPEMTEWRLRADVLAVGRFRHFVPVMLYDQIKTLNGRKHGYPGYAMERLMDLRSKYQNGSVFFFQPPGGSRPHMMTPVKVKIEDLQFKTYNAPKGVSGPGGIALVVMKEQ